MRIAVLASHGGSLLQAVIDACRDGTVPGKVVLVVSNNRRSGALARAVTSGIPTEHLSQVTHPHPEDLDRTIANVLALARADLVLLAGYMRRLGPITLSRFKGRLVNTHPALLPRFGGEGFYGSRVHAAVLAAHEAESGATVHYVEGDYDSGPIISQRRIAVEKNDTIETLEARVKELERELLLDTLASIAVEHSSGTVEIRLLQPSDLDAFRRIRLEALLHDPTAFSSSHETELKAPADKYRDRMIGRPDNFALGAFVADALIGIAGFHREPGPKRHHAGVVTGMYVNASYRGRGVARQLLREIISRAGAMRGLEQIELSVTAGNTPARGLYASLGFVGWGIQPAALKVDGVVYDEEHMVLRLRDFSSEFQ